MKRRPVLVTWHDAFDFPPRWATSSDLTDGPAVVHTVGWPITPDPIDGHLSLATSRTGKHYGGGIHIPRACIVKVRKL